MFRKEMIFFDDKEIRGVSPQLAYDCLNKTAPSSIASERTVAAADTMCTKINSGLKDNTTNCLCFLRAHFI
jgi:hypothetical protein